MGVLKFQKKTYLCDLSGDENHLFHDLVGTDLISVKLPAVITNFLNMFPSTILFVWDFDVSNLLYQAY